MMEMSENTKFRNTAGSGILSAKSGISDHAASNILDDLCFSKFGTFHGGVRNPQTILGLLCVPLRGTTEQNITARSRCLSCHLPCFQ